MTGYGHITVTCLVDASPGLGMKVNHSSFANPNNGEAFLHGYTEDGSPANIDGYVMWNGKKRTVQKAMVNPDNKVPYNKTIYIVLRLSSSDSETGTLYNVWYDEGWKYGVISIPTADDWEWAEGTDIVLGQYVEPGNEKALVDAYLYWPPRTASQASTQGAYEKAVGAQDTANTAVANAAAAQSAADTANGKIDGLKIGGKNLLRNTGTFIDWEVSPRASVVDDPPTGVKRIDFEATGSVAYYSAAPKAVIRRPYGEIRDKTVTFSMEVRSDDGANAKPMVVFNLNPKGGGSRQHYFTFMHRDTITATTEWQKVEKTMLLADESFDTHASNPDPFSDEMDFTVSIFNNSAYSMQMRRPKLEIGNVSTDWSPSPYDVEDDLARAYSDLQEQVDGKVQTWYQSEDPSSSWTEGERLPHDGDLWCYTGTTTASLKQNNIYRYNASSNTWTAYSANGDLFDRIDGKTAIFYGVPSATYAGVSIGDYLVDGTDGCSYRWDGSSWVKVTDYQEAVNSVRIGGRNLLVGSSEEWSSITLTGGTNQTLAVIPSSRLIDVPALGFQAGDRIQVSFDIKFSNDIAASGGGTKSSYIQGNANYGGGAWWSVNFNAGGGNKADEIGAVIASASKTGRISTWFEVAEGMVDGTYTGRVGVHIRFDYYTGTAYIRRVMVEAGTKPSDWRPAPEDTDAALSAMRDSLKAQIDQKVQTWQQSTDPSSGWTASERAAHDGDLWRYTGTSSATYTRDNVYRYNAASNAWEDYAANGDLFDRVDGKTTIFYGAPSGSYPGVSTGDYLVDGTDGCSYRWTGLEWVKLTDYHAAVSAIQIGGTNLLRNTGTFGNWTLSSYASVFTDAAAGGNFLHFNATGSVLYYSAHPNASIRRSYGEIRNKTVTFSMEVRSDDGASSKPMVAFNLYPPGGAVRHHYFTFMTQNTITVTTEWQKVSKTMLLLDSSFDTHASDPVAFSNELEFMPIIYNHSAYSLQVRRPKLEIGNVATDWSPAPWDVDYDIDLVRQTAEKAKYQTEVIVGTQTGTTAAWTGEASFPALVDGQSILFWLPQTSASNVTLNLTLSNGETTGAIPCYYGGTTRIGTHYAAGNAVRLLYRENVTIGTTTIAKGWWADANYNTNNYDRIQHTSAITARTAITAYHMVVAGVDGKYAHIAAGTAFDITKPILYAASAIAANKTGTGNYLVLPNINLAESKAGFTGTSQETVYIVGTLAGNLFTPNDTVFTTDAPSSDDGLYYVSLGRMRSTTNFDLYPEHPIYKWFNGKFQTTQQMAYEAFMQANHAQGDIDGLEIGGRNLLRETASFNGWLKARGTYTVDLDGATVMNWPETSSASWDYFQSSPYPLRYANLKGKSVTISFYYRSDDAEERLASSQPDPNLTLALCGGNSTSRTKYKTCHHQSSATISTEWKRLVWTGVVEDDLFQEGSGTIDDGTRLFIQIYNHNVKTMQVKHVKMEIGNRATDWSPAPEDFENHLTEETSKAYTNSVASSQGFFNQAIKDYVRTTDIETFKQTVRTELNHTAESIEMIFNTAVEQIGALSDGTASEFAEIKKYIRFVDGAIVLGEADNPLILRLVNNRISFESAGGEVAYFSDNRMEVSNVSVTESADLCGLRVTKDGSGNIFIN